MGAIKEACKPFSMRFLKKLREQKGLTQYAMAKHLGMIQQTYIHDENKGAGIKIETLSQIREKLGLSWDELGRLIDDEAKEQRKKKRK
jgi:transcriptional regulator with XRE-family HTH domain